MFFTKNIALFQLIQGTNSDLRLPNITPISDNSAGHMLKIIVVKKDTLARAYDRADLRDQNMARFALKLELLEEVKK